MQEELRLEIITDKTELRKKCSLSENPEATLKILKSFFNKDRFVGLAANQLGFDDRVAVVWHKKNDAWIDIVDWTIVEKEGKFLNYEGCLSLPGYVYLVPRYRKITTEDRNGERREWVYGEEGCNSFEGDIAVVGIQQEIDHYNGIILEDIAVKKFTNKDFVVNLGRNDLCNCGSGKKYKKCCLK